MSAIWLVDVELHKEENKRNTRSKGLVVTKNPLTLPQVTDLKTEDNYEVQNIRKISLLFEVNTNDIDFVINQIGK